jgi:hypothetical protein
MKISSERGSFSEKKNPPRKHPTRHDVQHPHPKESRRSRHQQKVVTGQTEPLKIFSEEAPSKGKKAS